MSVCPFRSLNKAFEGWTCNYCDSSWLASLCVLLFAICRRAVEEALSLPEDELELSMGMSGDFEQAVSMIISF
jgi:hypothetical protein